MTDTTREAWAAILAVPVEDLTVIGQAEGDCATPPEAKRARADDLAGAGRLSDPLAAGTGAADGSKPLAAPSRRFFDSVATPPEPWELPDALQLLPARQQAAGALLRGCLLTVDMAEYRRLMLIPAEWTRVAVEVVVMRSEMQAGEMVAASAGLEAIARAEGL